MRIFVALAALAAICGSCARPTHSITPTAATRGPTAGSLVGVWRVEKFCTNVDSLGREAHPFGEHPTGYFVYTPTGYLSLHAARTPPVPPFAAGDHAASDAALRPFGGLLENYFGYFGTYTITSDSTVTHHVSGGTIPSYIGTDQRRHYRIRFGGPAGPDTLSIGGYPAPSCRKLVRVG